MILRLPLFIKLEMIMSLKIAGITQQGEILKSAENIQNEKAIAFGKNDFWYRSDVLNKKAMMTKIDKYANEILQACKQGKFYDASTKKPLSREESYSELQILHGEINKLNKDMKKTHTVVNRRGFGATNVLLIGNDEPISMKSNPIPQHLIPLQKELSAFEEDLEEISFHMHLIKGLFLKSAIELPEVIYPIIMEYDSCSV